MRYGFVIDHTCCIGCHACSVACKEENQVPLGVYRTWVKYIERGTFPNTRRYFSVLRCNHCDNAPCVTICPTVALFRRSDGIVDFDGTRCIGCKSCMQACPYDALYIDPATQTAAKCHYCAHRVEVGLEPACVIVCPVQAIVAGDLDDPASRIARLVATEQVQVRKPEQGTRPKVFYLGADAAALTPQALERGESYLFAQTGTDRGAPKPAPPDTSTLKDLQTLARTVYDVDHVERPWGWKVATYLWTKAVAAGALLLPALGVAAGWSEGGLLAGVVAPFLALVFLALTTGLLIFDLKRPDRFHFILLKPNWQSWLVWGAWILIAFGAVTGLWLVGGLAVHARLLRVLAWPAILLAVAAAGYSAFLFGQAEGRDFWQSPLLLWHLLVGAVLAGAASLILAGLALGSGAAVIGLLKKVLAAALAAEALVLFAELFGSHPNQDVARAADLLTRGGLSGPFCGGVVLAGIGLPMLLLLGGTPSLVVASLLALAGHWLYELLWVRAGQSIPLS
ncbi:MAG: polysulfide reductase NrfD [Candidatus Rokubacteria bacterium]|nr:polysulfide reductase NrfD [Candidatus Rokubacteria bacterium]